MAEYFCILRIFPCCVIIMIYFLSPESSAAASESYFSTSKKKKKEAEDLALWLKPPAKKMIFCQTLHVFGSQQKQGGVSGRSRHLAVGGRLCPL